MRKEIQLDHWDGDSIVVKSEFQETDISWGFGYCEAEIKRLNKK
jgi:hypothetical protein